MPRVFTIVLTLSLTTTVTAGSPKPPIHIWFEPEWFEGVKGSFAYWPGPAKPTGAWGIAGPGEAWRQVDAVLITDDLKYEPVGREKPAFAFQAAMNLHPRDANGWRGSGQEIKPGWQRTQLAGRDFSMWTGIGADAKWWKN